MTTTDFPQIIRSTFDAVSDGYDRDELRFFPASARHMAAMLELAGDERVLDVACGTGHATLALADALPRGQVTGVDFFPSNSPHALPVDRQIQPSKRPIEGHSPRLP
jgi:ubiquinone/menaquinone biosynthesis C-methylase UbiE